MCFRYFWLVGMSLFLTVCDGVRGSDASVAFLTVYDGVLGSDAVVVFLTVYDGVRGRDVAVALNTLYIRLTSYTCNSSAV